MAYSADSIDSLVRFGPGGAPADVGDEGHLQADDTFHDLFHHGGQPLHFPSRHREVQLVVHLDHELGLKVLGQKTALHLVHGHLDDVGGAPLHGMVHGRALAEGPLLAVGALQLGNVALAAEHGLGEAALAGLGDGLVQVSTHAGVRLEVAVDHLAGLGHGDVQRLGESEGLLAVDDAEVHRLGAAAQLRCHRLHRQTEDARGRGGVEIRPGVECRYQVLVAGQMREQAQLAIDAADVVVLVTEIGTGVTAADQEVANMLLRSKKPVVLAVNKMDSTGAVDPGIYEFYSLGLGDPIAVSAVHGHGTGDLLDACLEHFPPEDADDADADYTRVAVIGKPNVGKSSLVNLILGEKRVIVSNVAGTTRDSVDTRFENKYGKYIFVDTAGIRRKSRVDDRIEKFSVMRAKLAIERADVCLIMIDARDGVTEQDTKIAGLAHEAGKASIIVVNKWDLVDKETGTMEKMRKDVLRDLSFMSYAPVLFISALTGQRTERLFELINFVNDQSAMRITTGMLNNVLADAQARVQPPTDKGRRLKIYYMTQTGVKPPCFVVFCNSRELFHFSYQRYLENQIRAVFGLEGTPIRMVIRQKGEQE